MDFNVPLDEHFTIGDDNRMRAAIPTIQKILSDGGSVILMSHLGRPKDGPTNKYSLKHIVPHLKELLGGNTEVLFADDAIGQDAIDKAAALQPGQVLLLENLRFYKEEEKGDKGYADKLSALGDVYVNDAFGTAHRAHASTAVMADNFEAGKKMFGLLMEGEVTSAEKVLHQSENHFVPSSAAPRFQTKYSSSKTCWKEPPTSSLVVAWLIPSLRPVGATLVSRSAKKTGLMWQRMYWPRPRRRV